LFYQNSEIVKEVFTPTVRLRLLKSAIIHYTYLPNAELGLEEAKFNHQAFIDLRTDVHPLLIDSMEGFINPTKEYADYIRSREPYTPLIGRAVVTNSLAHNLILSIYYKVNDTMYPFKVFKSYSEAENWLLTLPQIVKPKNSFISEY